MVVVVVLGWLFYGYQSGSSDPVARICNASTGKITVVRYTNSKGEVGGYIVNKADPKSAAELNASKIVLYDARGIETISTLGSDGPEQVAAFAKAYADLGEAYPNSDTVPCK